jgi:hypothetical protein
VLPGITSSLTGPLSQTVLQRKQGDPYIYSCGRVEVVWFYKRKYVLLIPFRLTSSLTGPLFTNGTAAQAGRHLYL